MLKSINICSRVMRRGATVMSRHGFNTNWKQNKPIRIKKINKFDKNYKKSYQNRALVNLIQIAKQ